MAEESTMEPANFNDKHSGTDFADITRQNGDNGEMRFPVTAMMSITPQIAL
ncbi:MAG TPA: hypothetical protein VFE62_29130 [Gemmataceae bacterium]|nr:hypothetical protein [Gemmataceae bacterium]